jgi:hypothetical protein
MAETSSKETKMRSIRNENEALMEALVMLSVVERGGSYDSADWYARVHKLRGFLSEQNAEEIHTHISFDLTACKSKIKK